MKNEPIIRVEGLVKRYREHTAVDGISFEVHPGEIFGMVGPNGAGKTTTIECIEGLRRPDAGSIRVLGMDPEKDKYKLKERIGIQLQESALPDRMKVWEAMDQFASFYPRTLDGDELLDQLGLSEKRNSVFAKLSGGQKQRLFIALALLHDPEVVFLDELTTGLDPKARRAIWDLVLGIRDRGKTVFLTTHFMEEAERLCNRIAVVDQGRIVALDSAENLIRSLDASFRVVFTVKGTLDTAPFRAIPSVKRIEQVEDRVTIEGEEDGLLVGVVTTLDRNKIPFRDFRTGQPSLEDVFLAKTGKQLETP
ncbi:MAG: ABC transporter ATP-binding protein [Bacteroidales bacterium]